MVFLSNPAIDLLPIPTNKKTKRYGLVILFGAGDGIQTRDLRLGKATLYQLSYSRKLSIYLKIEKLLVIVWATLSQDDH